MLGIDAFLAGIDVLGMGSNHVLHETTETGKSCIIKWHGLRSRRVYIGHRLYPMAINVVQPDPCRKMWLCGIEQTLHDLLNVRRHVPKLGMVDPVPRCIRGEGKVTNGISVDFVIESEEDTKARVGQDGMRRFGENVIT